MIVTERITNLLLVPAVMLSLAGCDYSRRISILEEEAVASKQQIDGLKSETVLLRSRVDGADRNVQRFALDLNGFRQVVSGRGRLSVTVSLNEWRTIYANSTGKSQLVRLTHRRAITDGKLDVRLIPVRRATGNENSTADLIVPPIITPDGPVWDMSPVGAQRSQRLPCGYEIQSRGEGGPHTIDILVLEDPHPVSCDG